jgi:uncharacterized membrane protein
MIREGDAETIWSRLHARQALVFGLCASLALLVVIACPLVAVVAVPTISIGATIAVYTVGLIADVVVAVLYLALALRFAARAARGDLFDIPVVSPIVDRFFRVKER